MRLAESRLILHLISREDGASFLYQFQREVKKNQWNYKLS